MKIPVCVANLKFGDRIIINNVVHTVMNDPRFDQIRRRMMVVTQDREENFNYFEFMEKNSAVNRFLVWPLSSAVEHTPDKREVDCSIQSAATKC